MITKSTITQLPVRINRSDPEKVIPFGSYAYGTLTMDSDVDLFVVKNVKREEIRELRISIRGKLRDIIFNQKVPVDLLFDSQDHINERIKPGDSVYEKIMKKRKNFICQIKL